MSAPFGRPRGEGSSPALPPPAGSSGSPRDALVVMSTGSGKSAIYQIAGLLPDWGEGIVQRYDDDSVVVLFDDVGYKTLALAVVLERSLLSAG